MRYQTKTIRNSREQLQSINVPAQTFRVTDAHTTATSWPCDGVMHHLHRASTWTQLRERHRRGFSPQDHRTALPKNEVKSVGLATGSSRVAVSRPVSIRATPIVGLVRTPAARCRHLPARLRQGCSTVA